MIHFSDVLSSSSSNFFDITRITGITDNMSRHPRPMESKFRNKNRLSRLLAALDNQDQEKMEDVIRSRSLNHPLWCLLHGKSTRTMEIKEDVISKVVVGKEEVIVKTFSSSSFPFHEICGNLLATRILDSGSCPFFVRTLDIGMDSSGNYVIVMESLESDISAIDLQDPVHMYNLFYQTTYACAEMEKVANLQHFDLRSDNIMVRMLPEPRDFFKNGIKTTFVIKICDFGQCEFDFGNERPVNEDIPRDPHYEEKWGVYPSNYTGYDIQYFLSTLPWILNEDRRSEYYIYTMMLSFLGEIPITPAQYRPRVVVTRTPTEILCFLKQQVRPTLE